MSRERELLRRVLDEVEACADLDELLGNIEAELAKPEPEPVAHQFLDENGKWCNFMDEKHYLLTVKDGSWPIRELYTSTPRQQSLSDDDDLLTIAYITFN